MLTRLRSDLRDMFLEQGEFKELLYQMTRRDLRLRYTQTVMGVGWAVFLPLVHAGIFSIVFMRVVTLDVGMPYPLFAFAGCLFWNFFASSLKFAVTSLTSNATLVTKVYFPREVFPFSAVLVGLVDTLVGGVVLVGLMAYYQTPVTPALLALPAVLLVQAVFTAAVALLVSMGNLFYRDVKYLVDVVLSVGMFATSVAYPVSLAGGTLGVLLGLNPMTRILEAYRDVLILGRVPGAAFGAVAAASVLLLAAAWVAFHRAEFAFAENV